MRQLDFLCLIVRIWAISVLIVGFLGVSGRCLIFLVSFVLFYACMPVFIGYVIDGEDHMLANVMFIFFGASVLRIIWWYGFLYTSLWLSERLKFRTMGSHDCSIFSVCFEAMKNCETQYKDKTQFLRLFGLRNVHAEDVHHVDANRLAKKKSFAR